MFVVRFASLKTISLGSLILFILWGGISCKKSEDNILKPNISITGRLVTNCENPMPVANKLLILETGRGIFDIDHYLFCEGGYKEVAKTFTNANGEFEFIYDKQRCIKVLQISIQDTTGKNSRHLPLVSYLRANKNDAIGGVYLATTKNYRYKIKTQQPYTANDTLFYNLKYTGYRQTLDSTYSFKAGPFTDGQLLSGFGFSGDSKIHDGILAGADDRYNTEIRWVLKKNGVRFKSGYSKMLFTDACEMNTVLLNFDD